MGRRFATVVIGMACVVVPLAAAAEDDEEEPEPGRLTIVVDMLSAVAIVLDDPLEFGPAPAARVRFEKAVSPSVSLWAAPQTRLTRFAFGSKLVESVDSLELSVGARYFPGGTAPEGFSLGGFASLGPATSTLHERYAEGPTLDETTGSTWSLGGTIGKEWITRGGLCLGLRLDVGIAPLSLREPSTGLFLGLGTSLGGVL